MPKENKQASSFLAKFKRQIEDSPKGVSNKVPEPPNAFRSVFAIQNLDLLQEGELEDLLKTTASEQKKPLDIKRDFDVLKNITAEIRSIQKQSAMLLGERIVKARELLKSYGDGTSTFTKWLNATFSSRRTAYNCIAYYEFYMALPNDLLRERLKLMSHKAVYMLASRTGDIQNKFQIVEECYDLKQDEIIPIIQRRLPLPDSEKRDENGFEKDLKELEKVLGRLLKYRQELQVRHKKRLYELTKLLIDL